VLLVVRSAAGPCEVLGRKRVSGSKGLNRVPFNGRVHGRPLAPGRYLIDVVVVRGKSHKRVGRVAVEIVKPGRQLTKAQLAAPVGVACATSTSSPSLPAAAVITPGAGASGPGDPARGGKSLPGRVLRAIFKPLEDLRNAINPIRVLHEAVRLAGIADTGPLLPLLTNVPQADHPKIREAAGRLLEANGAAADL